MLTSQTKVSSLAAPSKKLLILEQVYEQVGPTRANRGAESDGVKLYIHTEVRRCTYKVRWVAD